jgi:hypothetical protein
MAANSKCKCSSINENFLVAPYGYGDNQATNKSYKYKILGRDMSRCAALKENEISCLPQPQKSSPSCLGSGAASAPASALAVSPSRPPRRGSPPLSRP